MNDLWEIEEQCFAAGAQVICGVDEAGRGPLAGPVCAAAVILPRGLEIPGLNDSKKLTDRKRRALYDIIVEQAAAYGVALVDERTVDEINILQATFRAMGAGGRAAARCTGSGAGGRQPGARIEDGGSVCDWRGRQKREYCGGLHSGQGYKGPADGRTGQAVSAVRFCST